MYHFWHFNDHKTPRVNVIAGQMTPFFSSTLWAVSVGIFHFCISGPSTFNSLQSFWYIIRADDTRGGRGGRARPPTFLHGKKKKEKQRKKRKFQSRNLEGCFRHCRVSRIQVFFGGEPWWPTILFSVTCPLHFENHFAGPDMSSSQFDTNLALIPWTIGAYLNILQVNK